MESSFRFARFHSNLAHYMRFVSNVSTRCAATKHETCLTFIRSFVSSPPVSSVAIESSGSGCDMSESRHCVHVFHYTFAILRSLDETLCAQPIMPQQTQTQPDSTRLNTIFPSNETRNAHERNGRMLTCSWRISTVKRSTLRISAQLTISAMRGICTEFSLPINEI